MKKFFKKLLTSKITPAVLLGLTLGGALLTVLALTVPALAGVLGVALGITFVGGVSYGLTKYADFVISAKEGEKLGGDDGAAGTEHERVEGEDYVVTVENDATSTFTQDTVETPQERERKRIERQRKEIKEKREKYSIELDEMGK